MGSSAAKFVTSHNAFQNKFHKLLQSTTMWRWSKVPTFLLHWLFLSIFTFNFNTRVCKGTILSESKPFSQFIQAVDPRNLLEINWEGDVPDYCSGMWNRIKCDAVSSSITEIRLENLNLSGVIDAGSLCNLPCLQVLSLSTNLIAGEIPALIENCRSLTYLNLSNNKLHGTLPTELSSLKNLRSLDISNNNLTGPIVGFKHDIQFVYSSNMESNNSRSDIQTVNPQLHQFHELSESPTKSTIRSGAPLVALLSSILSVAALSIFIFTASKRLAKSVEEKKSSEAVPEFSIVNFVATTEDEIGMEDQAEKEKEECGLVFFGQKGERFNNDDLLRSAADLQGHSTHGSLYKVTLKDKTAVLAVKRLKNLHISGDDFRVKVNWIGHLKHPNLLPLLAYSSSEDAKLLIYRYQSRGSLSSLLSSYQERKIHFPWRQRLSIMSGVAKGLEYLARKSLEETAPHGNLKPSNILLSEIGEPLISEYGVWNFLDPKWAMFYSSSGYRAPERRLTKEADIYSFGVILLEILTGKTTQKTGINLPEWVKFMVREEWTGEVFDGEVNSVGRHWAFPLLNVALKCVSDFPEHRPDISQVLEKIEHVVNSQEDYSFSSPSSVESIQQDHSLITTAIPEMGETP